MLSIMREWVPLAASFSVLVASASGAVITFTDVTNEAGMTAVELGSNVAFADIDLDDDLDVLVWGVSDGDDSLYRNDGTAHFEDITDVSGIQSQHLNGWEYGGPFADFDNDGLPDVYVPTITTGSFIQNLFFLLVAHPDFGQ